jgi:EAL domain-containing protein (putative c-di-GMP-specific phosphodiesterase class I)
MTLPNTRSPAGAATPATVDLASQLDRIGAELVRSGSIGLLSVTVLPRRREGGDGEWRAYESMRREIHTLLRDFQLRRLRREDRLIEPVSRGNAFVLVLAPPREGGRLDAEDLHRVRTRLEVRLKAHLGEGLEADVHDCFGCYVGGSVLRHDPSVRPETILYRALDEAFADALRAQEREGRRHENQLREILASGSVRSVYQPVVDIVRRRIIGYEALTRIPKGDFETPDLLFRAASRHDALWSLERLCRERALAGLPPAGRDGLLFLNTEPESIRDPELRAPSFVDRLAAAGLVASQVVIEITEHAAVRDFVEFRRRLDEFRARGFRLAIDDVGSGYSGLQAIAEIAPDFIKVDMALIRDIDRHRLKRELIATIRRFSDRTGSTVVAEGVERQEELRSLIEAGVRCAQGYLFARPGAPPDTPDWSRFD